MTLDDFLEKALSKKARRSVPTSRGPFRSRQRELDLGPAHGAGVLLALHHPFSKAHLAAPVHARMDAEPRDRAVR